MSRVRVLLIALTILAMAAAPLLMSAGGPESSSPVSAYASTAAVPASDNRDDNDEDNDNVSVNVSAPRAPAAPAPAPAPACSTPGQEMSFQTDDGQITVRVFSSMTQSVKFSIRHPIEPASVPPAPGPVVGARLFQLVAETCDGSPIPVLPAEVNLGVRYTDADAAGMNEGSFTLGRLDTSANQWRQVEKQANDPPNNYSSATIREMGFYVLYQRS